MNWLVDAAKTAAFIALCGLFVVNSLERNVI